MTRSTWVTLTCSTVTWRQSSLVTNLHRLYTTTISLNQDEPIQEQDTTSSSSRPKPVSVLPPNSKKTPSFARKPKPSSRSIWKSPIPSGKIPAFDEALKYIRADARKLSFEAKELARVIKSQEEEEVAAGQGVKKYSNSELDRLREKLEILQIQSKINLPEVRFAFKMGRYPFQEPVFRHLTEQKWRKDGMLDLLMERIYQMHVVPDLLPELHPTIDLHIQFPWTTGHRTLSQRRREKSGWYTIEPGKFLISKQTRDPPRVATTAFHTDVRLYTMLMLDPDVPDEESNSFQTYLHWLRPNIPLSATYRNIKISPSDEGNPVKEESIEETPDVSKNIIGGIGGGSARDTPYIPPHPQRGTPYHRYVVLLLPHINPLEHLDIPVFKHDQRLGFNLREFAAQWDLALGPGGGAHMWRQVWDEDVSDIYNNVLHAPEPVYQRPRKINYVPEKRTKYVL
ncbi:hypothetical protein Clacol_008123 [Clathrus columnatus]|uniref:PEBP-like protein n=1 Tax=Clathrus columnatus TaxID=1419009 RepID=A0AAV5AN68_9AGAM|nr:hypothetical protein Clacol_008123 [Clathrus columnatus]